MCILNDVPSDSITVCTNDIAYDTDTDSFCTFSNVPNNNNSSYPIPTCIPRRDEELDSMMSEPIVVKTVLNVPVSASAPVPSQVKQQEDLSFNKFQQQYPDPSR